MRRFADRVALVTGASSGIGRATALRLAEQGAAVALVALPGDDLESAAAECRSTGTAAVAVPADVADSREVAAAFDHAETLGPVSAVFSNAGISIVGPAVSLTDDDWLRQLHVNLSGSFYVLREAARRMIPRRSGAIVVTGSELGLRGQPGYVGYTATEGRRARHDARFRRGTGLARNPGEQCLAGNDRNANVDGRIRRRARPRAGARGE